MAVKETLQIGDIRLKARNKRVPKISLAVNKVLEDLIDTMRENQLIGMAAPQIGENVKIFVTEPRKTAFRTEVSDSLRVYINPKITEFSQEQVVIYEGCGSVLNGQLFGPVKRPKEIVIEAMDIEGSLFRLRCNGILARVIQHEYDHLKRVEFTEKIYDYKLLMHVDFYRERIRNSPTQAKKAEITVNEYFNLQ
jgi:peptide deformylase